MISKRKLFKKQKGFSLVEVLCAIALLALVAAPVIQIIFTSLSVNAKSRKLLAATDLSSNIVEFISANAFEDYQYGPKATPTTMTGIRTAYYGADDSTSVAGLGIQQGGSYYVYRKANNDGTTTLGPVSTGTPELSKIAAGYKLKPTATDTYSGKKLYFKKVSYAGYTFDVCIYMLRNDNTSSKKYFTYDCIVEVLDPAKTNADGEVTTPASSIIKTSTCIPNTLKTN